MDALKGLYHADKLDEKSFIENFTIRLKEFQLIIDNLLQQNKKPLQHFLITGKRGMGKSTLLRRIYIEASKVPLNEKLIAVRLGAEQYRLSRLFKLWEMVIEHLGNNDPQLLEQKRELEKSKQYEENLIFIIKDYLTKTNKTLLLLIDNFDQFIDKVPPKDEHSLREVLILYPIQIVGNSVFYNEHFKSYNNPFFDFFKPIHLGNLNKDEAEEFIKNRAIGEGIENFEEIYNYQKGKINALRILSGGVPRTLLILLSIVSKKNTGDAVDYLHEMIEQVTPLYQDRMKALSAQQQEIMHSLAMRWDKTPVKELAAEMRIPSKSISAQLVQLEKSGYIKKVDIPGRNHYYEIDERFFNIWLLMSEAAPYDTRRVIWLTKWLDAFYSNAELKGFAKFCQTGLKAIKPNNRFFIVQALSESVKLEQEHKKQLINEMLEDLKDEISEVKVWADSYTKKVTEAEILLKKEILSLVGRQDFEKALNKLDVLKKFDETAALNGKAYIHLQEGNFDKAEKHYLLAVTKGSTLAMLNLGDLYIHGRKDIENAEKYLLMAVEKGDIDAMVNLGLLYRKEKKDIVSAEKYYLMAVEKGDTEAMFNLGVLYEDEKKDLTQAEKYYISAAEKGDTNAMFNLGLLYHKNEKKDIANAEKYYLMAAEKGDTKAMVNVSFLYKKEKKDIVSAEKYYLMAVKKGNTDAMFNLALLYEDDKNDISQAEKYYLMAVERGDTSAMFNLGLLYKNAKKDIASAEKYYLMAADGGDTSAMVNLGLLYKKEKRDIVSAEKYYLMAAEKGNTKAMLYLGSLYTEEKKDLIPAEKYYRMAMEKGNTNAMVNLALLYKNEKGDIITAEKYYLMAVEKNDTDAMINLGNLYAEKKDIVRAEKYYLMAVEKNDTDAMTNLGNLYAKKKDIVSAEKYYLMAIEKGNTNAMFNLGLLYEDEKNDIDRAEKYYLMAIQKGNTNAMVNLGLLYFNEKKDIGSAEKYYLMATKKRNTEALVNLGNLYLDEKKDITQAEKYYLMAVEKGNTSAMINLGLLYKNEKKDIQGAEKYYRMALELGDMDALVNLGNLSSEKKDLVMAEMYYLNAVEEKIPEAMGNLANLYFETNNIGQKRKALELSIKAVDLTTHRNIPMLNIHVGILLWNEKAKEAGKLLTEILKGPLHTDNNMRYISESLQNFLVFRQKHFLHKLFSSNTELIDRYKPIYYALLHEMQNEYIKDYLKMSSELDEPVKAILDFVTTEQKRLGI